MHFLCRTARSSRSPNQAKDALNSTIHPLHHLPFDRPPGFFPSLNNSISKMRQFSVMSPILMAEQPRPDADLKSYSCLTCRQRKVKCDRHNPCSNCVKAARQCSFIPPVRGKRKRTKAPKEGLHAKLRRYEELLKSYGAKIEPSEYDGDSDSETVSQPDAGMTEDADPRSKTSPGSFVLEEMKPRLIDKEGSSRYFDRYACCYFQPQIES